jgi:hypothetical protein
VTISPYRGSQRPMRLEPFCAGEAVKIGDAPGSLGVVGRCARPVAFRLSVDLRLIRAVMCKSKSPPALVKGPAVAGETDGYTPCSA